MALSPPLHAAHALLPLWRRSCPAGPRVLEHIVDTVVYMEGGRQQPVRLVSVCAWGQVHGGGGAWGEQGAPGVAACAVPPRAQQACSWACRALHVPHRVHAPSHLKLSALPPPPFALQVRCMKNRYGNTDEVGVFEMHDDGMQVCGWAAAFLSSALHLSNHRKPVDTSLRVRVSSCASLVRPGGRGAGPGATSYCGAGRRGWTEYTAAAGQVVLASCRSPNSHPQATKGTRFSALPLT